MAAADESNSSSTASSTLCEQIRHCNAQIAHWEERRDALLAEQQRRLLLAKIHDDPARNWVQLTDEQKNEDRELAVAAFAGNVDFFYSKNEKEFKDIFPTQFREDRDVWLSLLRSNGMFFDDTVHMPIPEHLRDDKEILMAACARYGDFIEQASNRLRDDPELVFVALADSPIGIEYTLKFASERLRADKDFLLQINAKTTWDFFWLESVSPHLPAADQEELGLAVAKRLEELMELTDAPDLDIFLPKIAALPHSLCDKKETMMVFIEANAWYFQHCSERLRADIDVVKVAFRKDPGTAVQFALDEAQAMDLWNDRELVLDMIRGGADEPLSKAPHAVRKDKTIFLALAVDRYVSPSEVPIHLRNDPDICFQVCSKTGHQEEPLADLCKTLLDTDRDRLMEAVSKNTRIYPYLPQDLQQDKDVGLLVLRQNMYSDSPWKETYGLLFDQIPSLVHSRQAMMATLGQRYVPGCVRERMYASLLLRHDKDFVIAACKDDPCCLDHVPPQFRWDRDVVTAALVSYGKQYRHDNYTFPLTGASKDFLVDNEDITRMAVKCVGGHHVNELVEMLPDSFFTRGNNVNACLKRGLAVMHRLVPNGTFRRNTHIVAASVKVDWRQFAQAAWALRTDRDFVLKLMDVDPRALRHANLFGYTDLRYYREILLKAVAKNPSVISYCFDCRNDLDFLSTFATSIKDKLEAHNTFLLNLCRGVLQEDCSLSILNIGAETATSVKKEIAEFAGIPVAGSFLQHRAASAAMTNFGF